MDLILLLGKNAILGKIFVFLWWLKVTKASKMYPKVAEFQRKLTGRLFQDLATLHEGPLTLIRRSQTDLNWCLRPKKSSEEFLI